MPNLVLLLNTKISDFCVKYVKYRFNPTYAVKGGKLGPIGKEISFPILRKDIFPEYTGGNSPLKVSSPRCKKTMLLKCIQQICGNTLLHLKHTAHTYKSIYGSFKGTVQRQLTRVESGTNQ